MSDPKKVCILAFPHVSEEDCARVMKALEPVGVTTDTVFLVTNVEGSAITFDQLRTLIESFKEIVKP